MIDWIENWKHEQQQKKTRYEYEKRFEYNRYNSTHGVELSVRTNHNLRDTSDESKNEENEVEIDLEGEVSQVDKNEISYGDYTELLYDLDDSENLVRLQEQLEVMTTQQAEAYLDSVVDRISQTEPMDPFLDSYDNRSDELSTKETEIYDYSIGIKLEDGVIIDIDVVGIIRQSPESSKIERIYTSPKITTFDILIPVMVSDSVLYSNHEGGVRDLTPQSFASHLSDVARLVGNSLEEHDGEYISHINKRINMVYGGLKNSQ